MWTFADHVMRVHCHVWSRDEGQSKRVNSNESCITTNCSNHEWEKIAGYWLRMNPHVPDWRLCVLITKHKLVSHWVVILYSHKHNTLNWFCITHFWNIYPRHHQSFPFHTCIPFQSQNTKQEQHSYCLINVG